MGIFEDGYLALQIDPHCHIVMIFRISTFSVALLLQCIIGIIAIRKMIQKPNIGFKANSLFMVSLFCVCLATTSLILFYVLEIWDRGSIQIFGPIYLFGGGTFFVSLLGTLTLRLYLTFKESAYEMSRAMTYLFITILLFLFVTVLALCILSFTLSLSDFLPIFYNVLVPALSTYFLGCALSIYFFVRNLSRLAQQTSLKNVNINPGDISLDHHQQQLSNLAAKFVMLFVIAIGSTILSQILGLAVNNFLRAPFIAIDLTINLLCIFLQFAFAKKHYRRCCGCCDQWFRHCLSRRTKRVIYQHTIKLMKRRSADLTVPSNPSSSGESAVSGSGANTESAATAESNIHSDSEGMSIDIRYRSEELTVPSNLSPDVTISGPAISASTQSAESNIHSDSEGLSIEIRYRSTSSNGNDGNEEK